MTDAIVGRGGACIRGDVSGDGAGVKQRGEWLKMGFGPRPLLGPFPVVPDGGQVAAELLAQGFDFFDLAVSESGLDFSFEEGFPFGYLGFVLLVDFGDGGLLFAVEGGGVAVAEAFHGAFVC
jgi:hypothetical protein